MFLCNANVLDLLYKRKPLEPKAPQVSPSRQRDHTTIGDGSLYNKYTVIGRSLRRNPRAYSLNGTCPSNAPQ